MNSPENRPSRRDLLFKILPSIAGPALLAACGGEKKVDNIAPVPVGEDVSPTREGKITPPSLKDPEIIAPITREEKLMAFVNSVLKKDLKPEQIMSLERVEPDKEAQRGYAEFTAKIPGDGVTIYLSRTENLDGKLKGQFIQVERRDQKENTLDITLGLFNEFLDMPANASSRDSWKITQKRPDLTYYELPVVDNPDGPDGKSFTTRSAFVLTQRSGDYAVVVGSTYITENSPAAYNSRSGLS